MNEQAGSENSVDQKILDRNEKTLKQTEEEKVCLPSVADLWAPEIAVPARSTRCN